MPKVKPAERKPPLRSSVVLAALVTGALGILAVVATGILGHLGQLPGQATVTVTTTVTSTATPHSSPGGVADPKSTKTSTSIPTNTTLRAGDVLLMRSNIRIPDNTELDFDPGASNWPVGQRNSPGTDLYVFRGLNTLNLSQIAYFGATAPSYQDCHTFTAYSMNAIDAARFKAGNFFCVETGEDRVGSFKVESLDGSDILMSVTVWAKSSDAG